MHHGAFLIACRPLCGRQVVSFFVRWRDFPLP
jgi:hypothetical protein